MSCILTHCEDEFIKIEDSCLRSDHGGLSLQDGLGSGVPGKLIFDSISAHGHSMQPVVPSDVPLQRQTPPRPPQLALHLAVEETVEDGNDKTLEGPEGEFEEDLDLLHVFIIPLHQVEEHDVVDPEQRDQQEGGFSQAPVL